MFDRNMATNAVIEAIEANGTDTANRDAFDIASIVTDVYALTGTYDMSDIAPMEFWSIVESHAR